MGAQENVQTVKQIYEAFDRGDVDAILKSLAENVDWGCDTVAGKEVPWLRLLKGREAVREQFFGSIAREVNVEVFDRKAFVASDNYVAVAYHVEGTFKKNGKKVSEEAMHLWTFNEDGKVAHYRQFEDTAAILEAWRG